jgi:uncharacterized RDD family membrane protein YckC
VPGSADEPSAPSWQPYSNPAWQPPAPPSAPAWPPPEGGYPTSPPPPPPPAAPAPPPPLPGYAPPPAPPGYAPPPAPPGYTPPPAWQPPAKPVGPHGQPIVHGLECASWGSRVGAFLLDFLFAFVIPLGAGIALASSGGTGLEIVGGILMAVAFLGSWLFYAPLLMMRKGRRNGQTLGKQIVGIRVIRDGGEPMGFGWGFLREALVRWLLIAVIGGFFFIPPLLDVLWPLWDDQNRALHDMMVSTHVVRADEPAASPVGLT